MCAHCASRCAAGNRVKMHRSSSDQHSMRIMREPFQVLKGPHRDLLTSARDGEQTLAACWRIIAVAAQCLYQLQSIRRVLLAPTSDDVDVLACTSTWHMCFRLPVAALLFICSSAGTSRTQIPSCGRALCESHSRHKRQSLYRRCSGMRTSLPLPLQQSFLHIAARRPSAT